MRAFSYSLSIILSVFLFLSCGTESTPTYTLSTSVIGEGAITPSGGTYEEGETVTLTSTPSQHWIFQNWSGDGSGSSSTVTITMDRDKSVVGNFSERLYPLNITYVGEGTVEEEVIQSKSEHTFGTVVQLTPKPSNGWKFDNWSGGVTSTDEVVTVTVDGEVNVTVTFERIDYPLTITIVGEGEVEQEVVQSKTTEYPYETVIQLTPKPSEGWRFVEWGGDLSGNDVPTTVTITEGKNVTVTFERIVYLGGNGITIMCPDGEVGDIGVVNGVEFEVVDRELLLQRIEEGRGKFNRNVCVSLITDMNNLFRELGFNEPIGDWDVSNVTDMSYMFRESSFNQPIGDWNVSSVTDMSHMFSRSEFNQSIGEWDVKNAQKMDTMFEGSIFNQPIGDWNVSSVTDMSSMFNNSNFNQPIGEWDVGNVTDMSSMFNFSQFNQLIDQWDVSSVLNMRWMFRNSVFNQPIGDWDVSSVTDMSSMFVSNTVFNQPIGEWDTENVLNMDRMFQFSLFNQNISNWCVWRIGTEPTGFSSNLTPENKPKWGTCPD